MYHGRRFLIVGRKKASFNTPLGENLTSNEDVFICQDPVRSRVDNYHTNHESIFKNMMIEMLSNAIKCEPLLLEILDTKQISEMVSKIYYKFFLALIFIHILASWKDGYVYSGSL